MRSLSVLFAALLLALLASSPAAAQQVDLRVTAPQPGATIQGSDVTVTFEVAGFTVTTSPVAVEQAGQQPQANRPGEGHVHLTLDLPPFVVHFANSPYTFRNVPPGEHVLMVELVNNDHSPLNPPVVRQVRFRTEAAAPASAPATVMPQQVPRTGDAPAPGWLSVVAILAGISLIAVAGVLRRRA
jgi:hypothetical protein